MRACLLVLASLPSHLYKQHCRQSKTLKIINARAISMFCILNHLVFTLKCILGERCTRSQINIWHYSMAVFVYKFLDRSSSFRLFRFLKPIDTWAFSKKRQSNITDSYFWPLSRPFTAQLSKT